MPLRLGGAIGRWQPLLAVAVTVGKWGLRRMGNKTCTGAVHWETAVGEIGRRFGAALGEAHTVGR